MILLLTATIFLSALLLFLVQPMVAKLVLPDLGGSPSVWITCMLFFQVLLLLGYGYAHWLTRSLGPRAQAAVHAAVVLAPLLLLPLALPAGWVAPAQGSPAGWLLAVLSVSVGPPFLVLAATGPLLQRWFSRTRHRDAGDPYFLYAAGNVGSLIGLLAYPFLLEPALPLAHGELSQTRVWSVGYGLFAASLCTCAVLLHVGRKRGEGAHDAASVGAARRVRSSWTQCLRWVGLAFLPSSVLLGATQYISTDIAAAPLLWVLPLALYLLTFILAFSRRLQIPFVAVGSAVMILVAGVFALMATPTKPHVGILVGIHLATLFAVGLACHGALARARPPAEELTSFYLWIALGGALGGVVNALLAPVVFDSVLEYPLALLAVSALVTLHVSRAIRRRRLAWTPWTVPLALVGVLVWVQSGGGKGITILHRARSFFGVHRVMRVDPGSLFLPDGQSVELKPYHVLVHGTTRHGMQYPDAELRSVATAYYHRTGPIGQVFAALDGDPRLARVGLIGLGAGTLAAYARPGRRFTFFEIDPEVARIARDPRWFTYLDDAAGAVEVRIGDGRLEVARLPDGVFGLLVLDAFSSDAIPVHLLTREALTLYLRKLRPDGLVALHITNQYVDLRPVLEALMADLGLAGRIQTNRIANMEEALERKEQSTWAVLARNTTALGPLADDPRWERLAGAPASRARYLWTDDASHLLGVLRF